MANAFVQVAPDSTGKKMQTFENVVSANTVEAEAVVLVRSTDNTEIGTATQPVRIDPTGTTIQPDNVSQWGGTAVSAPPATGVPAAGTEVAPVVKPLEHKLTQILTTTNLLAAGNFTSAWFDTNQTGDVFVQASVFANVSSAASGFAIDESDDSSDANMTRVLTGATVNGNSEHVLTVIVRARFWRVRYTNGGTNQTTFKLTVTSSSAAHATGLFATSTGSLGTAIQGGTIPLGASPLSTGIVPNPFGALITAPNYISGSPDTVGGSINFVYSGSTLTGTSAVLPASVPFLITGSGLTPAGSAQRTPNIFKTVAATAAGNTAVWTPAAGKKFRLMRVSIQITSNAAQSVAGVFTVDLQDSASTTNITSSFFVPSTAGTAFQMDDQVWMDLGNGVLSAAANNVLNVNLSAALSSGVVRVVAMGTEE